MNERERVPYTEKPILNDDQDFHFAIVPDRSGGEREGIFGKGIAALNLLRPEFVITVGDMIENCSQYPNDAVKTEEALRGQYNELDRLLAPLNMRFYSVVGNHDIWTGWPRRSTIQRDISLKLWKERYGEQTYYDFMYKGCHFVCLDSMEGRDGRMPVQGITDQQYAWAREVIEAHKDARWTLIFMHMPLDWASDKWLAFERDINHLNYTVFCGDWHNHVKAVRNGKNYYMLGTCGGCFDKGIVQEDLRYGIMDSVTWVTMTSEGPVVANLQLSGIFGDEIQRCATTKGWIETPLDYPDHLTINDGYDAERMWADGYDWHFRHARIVRNGWMLVKPDIVLAGDDILHRWGGLDWFGDSMFPRPPELNTPFFTEHRVLNMGFMGDRNEHLLWRIRHGELSQISPKTVIMHIGSGNLLAGESAESTVAGVMRNLAALNDWVPSAQVKVLAPLEPVPYEKEFNELLQRALGGNDRIEFLNLAERYRSGGIPALEEYFLGIL